MDEIILIKPTIEYADDIMRYRQEFLDSNDDLAGCGNLRNCLSADEWIKTIDLLAIITLILFGEVIAWNIYAESYLLMI